MIGLRTLTKEAELRNGVPAVLREEPIKQYISERLHVPADKLAEGEKPLQFLTACNRVTDKIDTEGLTEAEYKQLPEWQRIEGYVMWYLQNGMDEFSKRWEELDAEEPTLTKFLVLSTQIIPSSERVDFVRGFMDVHGIYKTHYELSNLKRFLGNQ